MKVLIPGLDGRVLRVDLLDIRHGGRGVVGGPPAEQEVIHGGEESPASAVTFLPSRGGGVQLLGQREIWKIKIKRQAFVNMYGRV